MRIPNRWLDGRQRRWRSVWRAIGVGLAMSLAAAGGSAASMSLPATTAAAASLPRAPVAATAAGCGRAAAAGSVTLDLTIGGRQRVVIVHIPAGNHASQPVPLVLNLHGSGSTARQQERFTGMDATADRDGFIVAYPQALIPGGGGFDWNITGVPLAGGTAVPKDAADDVAFLTELVSELAARYCIDPHRVFATGMSGGGRMSSQLACDAPTVFAAVAPVAGLRFPSPCPTSRAVPVIAFHGTADPDDPYIGGGQAYWTYSVPTAAQRWAVHNRCQPFPQTSSGSGYTLTTYTGCAAGASVELYTLTGEGHEWPGGPAMPAAVTAELGPQSDAIDANTTMWAFFVAHSRQT